MARKSKKEVGKAISKLEELVKTRGILAYSERDLSLLLGLTEKTIRKHLKSIKTDVGSRTIESITQTFIDDLDMMMTDIRYYWKKAKKEENEKSIMYYTDKMFKAWERFADLLERFGIKNKVAEKLEIKEEKVSLSINMDMEDFEHIKELESRRA